MSKRHFVAMAREISLIPDRATARIVAESFARVAQRANPRFDHNRFLAACGV
jgi:hypothetical protein